MSVRAILTRLVRSVKSLSLVFSPAGSRKEGIPHKEEISAFQGRNWDHRLVDLNW